MLDIVGYMPRDEQEIREALEHFIQRRGHGAVKEVTERIGLSRHWLKVFRRGKSIGRNYVDGLEAMLFSNENIKPSARQTPDPIGIVSDELRALADYLDSPEFRIDDKVEKFSQFVTFYSTSLPRAVAAFKKSRPSGD